MKVLHLITGLGAGGAEHMLTRVISNISEKHVVVSLTNNDFFSTQLDVPVKFLGLNWVNLPWITLKLWQLIKKENPNIINTYLLHTNIYGRFIGKLCGKKVVCSVRNIHRGNILSLVDRWTQCFVDAYTPNSKAVASFLISIGIKKEKITIIPNGLSIKEYRSRINKEVYLHRLGIPRKTLFGMIASFKKQKGHNTLIEAFARLDKEKAHLLLAGDGKLRQSIERLVQNYGMENVTFLGLRKDIPQLLKLIDYLVLPSYHEGMPNILLEAMAAGTPIICSNIPENKEVVGEAIFFPPGDKDALLEALQEALRGKRRQIIITANNKKIKKYNIHSTSRKLLALYRQLA